MDKEKLINDIMKDAAEDGEPITREEAEEMAKKKLGLVHDNEIIFKSGNGK